MVAPVVVVVTPVVVDDAPVTAGPVVVVVSGGVDDDAPVPEQAVTRQAARRKRTGRFNMLKEANERSRFVIALTAQKPLPTGVGSPQADRFECNPWEGGPMPKYLVQATISLEGLHGTLEEGGTARQAAVATAVESMGGTLDAYYYAFGDTDVVAIVDMPGNVEAAGLSLAIASTGAVSISTTPLLTPADIDGAAQLHPNYRPPGQVGG